MNKKISIAIIFLLFFAVASAIFTGCSPKPPQGYLKNVPIKYYQGCYLDIQFPDLSNLEVGKMHFLYDDKIHYIVINENYAQGISFCDVYYDKEKIGSFIDFQEIKDDKRKSFLIYAVFLDENYLYYGTNVIVEMKYFYFHADGFTKRVWYYKCEFFRFNIETGQNESIDLPVFYEKLCVLDNAVKLK